MLALEQAIQIVNAQQTWDVNDDACDCTHQRVGYWYNPYHGEVLETRLCCVWAELEKQYPQFFRRTYVEPVEWNALDTDMPRSIWYRQLAALTGKPLAEIRAEYAEQEPPQRLIPAPTEAQLAAIANAPITRRKRFFGLF